MKGPEAFRTISEAASELGVPQHVLRFWETKFSFIRPMKRAGGRRFYRRQDIEVLRGVRTLLHDEGYTIKGVQRLHKEQGVRRLLEAGAPGQDAAEQEMGGQDDASHMGSATAPEAPTPTAPLARHGSEAHLAASSQVEHRDASWGRHGAEPLDDAPADHVAEAALLGMTPEDGPHPVLDDASRGRLLTVLNDLETVKARLDRLLDQGC